MSYFMSTTSTARERRAERLQRDAIRAAMRDVAEQKREDNFHALVLASAMFFFVAVLVVVHVF